MSFLEPMSKAFFPDYIEELIVQYAQENVDAGRWPEEGALTRSRSDTEKLLPHGIETEHNHFFAIKVPEINASVGNIWLSTENSKITNTVFIYDLEIKPEYRRQGYAKLALKAIEDFAVTHNLANVGLHVFSYNEAAKALYVEMGFQTVSLNMMKAIG